jgi:hypothetical protein
VSFWPYRVTHESVRGVLLNPWDSFGLKLFGIPRLPGDNPAAIAKEALRGNAHGVLYAGKGHFRFMWASDFAKACRGAKSALPAEYLAAQVALMIRHSKRMGHVSSCFTPSRGFDMPYDRGDNLPWLLHAAVECGLRDDQREDLQRLVDVWEDENFTDGMIASRVTGDWMDTLLRPSSTYNNICALYGLKLAPRLGIVTRHSPAALEERILENRWRKDHFTDYAGTTDWSVDAAVAAMYLEVFDRDIREAAADRLEASGLAEPFPIRCAPRDYDKSLMPFFTRLSPRYHSVIWLHLGMMYLNGLRRLGRDVSKPREKFESLVMKYGNVLETLEPSGEPYRTLLHSTEHGFSMASGQYLELIGAN